MFTKTQIAHIKEHLEKAQNPVFFFDNDADGLCSFLLLQRFIGKGRGVAVKSFPDLTKEYFRRVEEFNADYIFILDKPMVSNEFFEEAHKINIPVVWIDHHKTEAIIPGYVNYYNSDEPTTCLCWQVTEKPEDLWVAVVGCIADSYLPDFYKEFQERYPDLSVKAKNAFDVFYKSPIGNISKMFSFGLKDRTTNVVNMLRFLMKVKTPYEVLEDTSKNHTMHERFEFIYKKHKKFMEKAIDLEKDSEKFLFFQYGGDMSISSDLANELIYLYPDKIIVVVYVSGAKANISARGKNIKKIILKAIEGLENATGGGHEEAVGAKVNISDLEEFRSRLVNS